MNDDVAAWLTQWGLGQYAQVFADNDIDFTVLPLLDERHLEQLGFSLGHRIKLRQALTERLANDGGAPQAADGVVTEKLTPAVAERRQLTVMFVDLVDSTPLSTQLDPEELRELILAYQRTVAAEVVRFAGYVGKFMGDGVLAYFGWPVAHEAEAERAVRAALAANAAVARLSAPTGKRLQARVGIATGLVVVGDLIGEGAAQEETVVGATPNLAARLQNLAEPGTVVISAETRRLLGGVFDLRSLGLQVLRGIAEPVEVFVVLNEAESVRPMSRRSRMPNGGWIW